VKAGAGYVTLFPRSTTDEENMKIHFKTRDAARKYARTVNRKHTVRKVAPFNGLYPWAVVIF
jgi:hypothetical protein